MTALTSAINAGMIETTIHVQIEKTGGIVAVITFGFGYNMKFRLADSQNTVMTFTTITKNFLMIGIRNNFKSLRGMAGLAGITGSDMIRWFRCNEVTTFLTNKPIMTIHTV
jgi:hypothetical protein